MPMDTFSEKQHELPPQDSEVQRPPAQRTLFFRVLLNFVIAAIALSFLFKHWPSLPSVRSHGCHNLTIEERAHKILEETPLIDGHNDLLIAIRMHFKNHIYGSDFKGKFENGGMPQQVDQPRLDEGKQGGAFWSAFMPCPIGKDTTDFSNERYHQIVRLTLEALDLYYRLGAEYPKYFTPSKSVQDAEKAFLQGRLISPAAIEGLHQIGNSISTLRLYYQLGVRYATLTWNCHNAYADAALETTTNIDARIATPYWHGLSPAGRDIIREMNRLGMIVDLAHVSQETMRDVLVGINRGAKSPNEDDWRGSIAPPIFSHSSVYAICPHPRNVPDDILELVKQRGSLVMINFSPGFISCVPSEKEGELPTTVMENATLAQVVRHITYIGNLIGYDYVGIGTDYDGIDATPTGLEDVSKFPALVEELLRQGIGDDDVSKIVGGNLLRVWAEVDDVAKELQKTMLPLEDDVQNNLTGAAMVEEMMGSI